jgi:hypothetical protein
VIVLQTFELNRYIQFLKRISTTFIDIKLDFIHFPLKKKFGKLLEDFKIDENYGHFDFIFTLLVSNTTSSNIEAISRRTVSLVVLK